MAEQITKAQIIELLNEALRRDPDAISNLINHRVPCNKMLAEHPTIQVAKTKAGGFEVGLLGIINGLCATNAEGRGCICFIVDSETIKVKLFDDFASIFGKK